METYKLQLKIGAHEFSAEGTEEAVRRDFEEWKALVAKTPQSPGVSESDAGGSRDIQLDEKLLSRVFHVDDDSVSLKIQPQSDSRDADAILLILLGARAKKGLEELTVIQLKAALQQSGCRVERVDRAAGIYVRQGFLHKGGMAKGSRYSLTNSGLRKAQEILQALDR